MGLRGQSCTWSWRILGQLVHAGPLAHTSVASVGNTVCLQEATADPMCEGTCKWTCQWPSQEDPWQHPECLPSASWDHNQGTCQVGLGKYTHTRRTCCQLGDLSLRSRPQVDLKLASPIPAS